MKFEFATATRVIFGAGTLREIGEIAKPFGSRALVVTGRDTARAETLLKILADSGISASTFSTPTEPEISTIQNGVRFSKSERCEIVIGFGGGSALDAAKAIAAMLTNEGDLLDYLEVIGRGKALTKPSAPFIAIPTTAGTGSEVTRNAVLASWDNKVKVSLRSTLMLAKVTIVDPELTYDLPSAITASTGLDALTQLIEPFVCSRENPMTDGLCREGIIRATRSLRVACTDGRNVAAREDMSVAGLFGGMALANAGLGAVHGLAGPIGGMFPAPHGAVCAGLLQHVMAANIRALRHRVTTSDVLHRYDEIARLLTGNSNASADDGVDWTRKLVSDLQIPPLQSYGIRVEHISEIVSKAANASSMKANPITLTSEELAEILRAAL